jgi:hypothetical protein
MHSRPRRPSAYSSPWPGPSRARALSVAQPSWAVSRRRSRTPAAAIR